MQTDHPPPGPMGLDMATMKEAVAPLLLGECESVEVPLEGMNPMLIRRHRLEKDTLVMSGSEDGIQFAATIFPGGPRRPGAYPGFIPFFPNAWTCLVEIMGTGAEWTFAVFWSDIGAEEREILLQNLTSSRWEPLVPVPVELSSEIGEQVAFMRAREVRVVTIAGPTNDRTLWLLHVELEQQ